MKHRIVIAMALAAALGACGSNEEPTEPPADEVEAEAEPAPEPEAEAEAEAEIQPTAEQIPVEADFEAEARADITADNFEAELGRLEAEIEGEGE